MTVTEAYAVILVAAKAMSLLEHELTGLDKALRIFEPRVRKMTRRLEKAREARSTPEEKKEIFTMLDERLKKQEGKS